MLQCEVTINLSFNNINEHLSWKTEVCRTEELRPGCFSIRSQWPWQNEHFGEQPVVCCKKSNKWVLCNSMGWAKVKYTARKVHQTEWHVIMWIMTWHHGTLMNTENTNQYYLNAANWTSYFERPQQPQPSQSTAQLTTAAPHHHHHQQHQLPLSTKHVKPFVPLFTRSMPIV